MRTIIFAANGYLGKVFVSHFAKKGQVTAITRKPYSFETGVKNLIWDGKTYSPTWGGALDGADLVINLAGRSVNCRYTEANKKDIFDSRTNAVQAISDALLECRNSPKLWINAASATIYRHAEDRPMDEMTGDIGTGFSVEVCKKWEKVFFECPAPNTRKLVLRIAITLGQQSAVIHSLKNLVRFGLGGKMGNGRQMFSWIHDQDLCRIIDFVQEREELKGIYNAASPHPITNKELMRTLRHEMKMPFGIPSPAWLLKIGAWLIGTETELILKSRWVVPKKLMEAGFHFQFTDLDNAVRESVSFSY